MIKLISIAPIAKKLWDKITRKDNGVPSQIPTPPTPELEPDGFIDKVSDTADQIIWDIRDKIEETAVDKLLTFLLNILSKLDPKTVSKILLKVNKGWIQDSKNKWDDRGYVALRKLLESFEILEENDPELILENEDKVWQF